ncbi:MAG: crosslink repair DNA glycosylase YcaQ family protein, partial [Planctomycetota bacterium]|nr:crosslink repair DNA glycosylase YcaQ family protein [Planctomycetota bacterium]
KPAKRALEVLFDVGTLMVAERQKFQRRYDLAERVLPDTVDTREPDARELGRFLVRQSLKTQGVAPLDEIRWGRGNRDAVERGLNDLVSSGEAVACEAEGSGGDLHYALSEVLDEGVRRGRKARDVHILSPFDNAVIQRRRLKRIFGFDFKLEAYFPADKREYGYFCLPILWGDRFIGRVDAKADRKQKVLVLKALLFERGLKDPDEVIPPLGEKLREFAKFNGCEEVVVEGVRPKKLLSRVRRET